MNLEQLRSRVAALHLNGVLAHWSEVASSDWLPKLGVFKQTAKKSHRIGKSAIFLHQLVLYPHRASDRRI